MKFAIRIVWNNTCNWITNKYVHPHTDEHCIFSNVYNDSQLSPIKNTMLKSRHKEVFIISEIDFHHIEYVKIIIFLL